MDGQHVARWRLHAQRLAGPSWPDPLAVVRGLGAVQAQEYAVAKWSLAQRCLAADDPSVQRLIDEGDIVRTHALRPTWHFLAAEDVGWVQALTGPRVNITVGHYYRQFGLDDGVAARAGVAITRVLRGGNHLTRSEVGAALATEGIEATGTRLAHVMMRAELDGLVVNGPMRGKQHTYALASERITDPWAPDEPLAELTRRYFTGHGPATVKDFAWWSSLTVAQIRRGIALLGSELESFTHDGLTLYYAGEPLSPAKAGVSLLQNYDEYVVGFSESRRLLNLAGRTIAGRNENALIHPLIADGQAIGQWRREVGRDRLTVTPELAVPATEALRRSIDAAITLYGQFTRQPVEVTWAGR